MSLRITRRTAASAAVAITALLAGAAPASAASGDASAFGATAKLTLLGKPAVEAGPFAASSVNGPQENSLAKIDVPNVVTTGLANTSAKRSEKTGAVNAQASTADVALTVLKTIAGGNVSAALLEARCEATEKGTTGSAKLVDAKLGKLGTVDAAPAANTTIDVKPGDIPVAKLIFNEQIKNPDGSLTVNALRVRLLEGKDALGSGDVVVSSTTCAPESKNDTTATPTTSAQPTATSTSAGGAVPTNGPSDNATDTALAATGANTGWLIGGGILALIAGFVAMRIVRSRKFASE